MRWAPPEYTRNVYGYAAVYPHWLVFGKYGVHLFFVISGLVITMTVLRSRSTLDFLGRRAARLWPAMIVCATLTFVISSFVTEPDFKRTLADYVASLTFDPADLHRAPVDGSYWSLGIEVKFYAVVAVGFVLLRQRFHLFVAAVAALSGLAALAHHGQNLLFSAFWPYFVTGMAGWYWLFDKRAKLAAVLGLEAGALLIISNPGLQATALIAAAVAVMFGLVRISARLPLLPALGRVSYSFYLLHQVLGVLLIQWLVREGVPDLLAATTALAAILALAALSYELVEKPGARLIHQIGRVRSQRLVPEPV